ncbi:MAG: hypothetical protein R3E11_09785 [Sphingobium sp.]|nr:hypothetical protein [Sphingobium sp.]MCP5399812.1 hypothetical protein [Sphingomonas sp.]
MDIGILVPLVAISIPVVAILSGVAKKWIALKEKQLEQQASMTAESAAQYAAHTERLEQRVQVLERIVTDRGVNLADEIEALRDTPPSRPMN